MSLYDKERGYDMFDDEDSESENETSSEDEIDIILHGTPEQRKRLQHQYKKEHSESRKKSERGEVALFKNNSDSSSEDDFEKEMNAELDKNVKSLEKERRDIRSYLGALAPGTSSSSTTIPGGEAAKAKTGADEFYDEIYFDSDEEMEDGSDCSKAKKKDNSRKHHVISNDDLLYDPDMDDDDQRWVDGQRRQHSSRSKSKNGKREMMPNSDALLDCPACMTTLCIDCQRHETYKHQYRAMFVMNCSVDTTESLQCPEQASKKQKKKKKQKPSSEQASSESSDLFHPVKCTECSTVVGVIDTDEVYHFFNILASHT